MSAELVKIENVNALEVFATSGGLDPIIEKIKKQVKTEHFDVSTDQGRKRIASVARQIGSAKSTLESMAMNLTEDWRQKTSAVNAEKKRMKEELDSLRDEIKAPLDEYRQREAKRIEDFESRIDSIKNADVFEFADPTTDMISQRIELVDSLIKHEWQEFEQRAKDTHEDAKKRLNELLEARQKRDAEQAELERLRKEQAERERMAHEERIAKEAAEKARIEVEQKAQREREDAAAKAKAEQERFEREKVEAENRLKAAEQARIDSENKAKEEARQAELKAKADKEAAIQAERQRQEAEKQAEADALAKREADLKHRAKINNEAKAAIIKAGSINDANERAESIIRAIAKGDIPHVKIIY